MKLRQLSVIFRITILVGLLFSLTFNAQDSKASPDQGAIIVVNTLADELTDNDGLCSLREAIIAANHNTPMGGCPAGTGLDSIVLPVGTIVLTIPGADEEDARSGDLDITSDMRISGKGINSTFIDGGKLDRVFHVTVLSTVRFSHLTIQNGYARGIYGTTLYGGGGLLIDQGNVTVDHLVIRDNKTDIVGGGIDNGGTLTVTYSTLQNNQAESGGGGILNVNELWLMNSAILTNTSTTNGGGVSNRKIANITNVTFSGNTGTSGGALYNAVIMNVRSSTISGNTSAIYTTGIPRFTNTIIANSTGGQNCITDDFASITTEGFNLEDANTCQFTHTTDKTGTPAGLGPLADNGGPTLTFALEPGSPAIDPQSNQQCPILDQRGLYRPGDGNEDGIPVCDVGALEMNAKVPVTVKMPFIQRR